MIFNIEKFLDLTSYEQSRSSRRKGAGGRRYDICLMNPPYSGITHMKFLEKCLNLVSDNGYIVQISPNIFIKTFIYLKSGKYRDVLRNNLEDIEIIEHTKANQYFGLAHAINELAIYTVHKNTDKPVDVDMLGFDNEIQKSIFYKILKPKEGRLGWENKNTKRHGEQKGHFVNLYTWHTGPNAYKTCINDTSKFSRTVYFDNETQVKNFRESFNTEFMEFYSREVIWAGNGITDKCFMFEKEMYDKPVTNETFFKFFELTDEEQKYILDTVKNYK